MARWWGGARRASTRAGGALPFVGAGVALDLAEAIEVSVVAADVLAAADALVLTGGADGAAGAAEAARRHEVGYAADGRKAALTAKGIRHGNLRAYCPRPGARTKGGWLARPAAFRHAGRMVRINRVYTRTGDDGTTALAGGQRVPKESLRIEAYGTLDELNSAIGVAVAAGLAPPLTEPFGMIQQQLFNLGAELASPAEGAERRPGPGIEGRHVEQLESWLDGWNEELEPLASFVLPGGNAAAAHLHLARTICRRAERATIALSRGEEAGAFVVPYLNRLSDLLFVAARLQNHLSGHGDVLWDSRGY